MATKKHLEILLVEDNPSFYQIAGKVIKDRGHNLDLAHDYKCGQEKRKSKGYDYILIDGFFDYSSEQEVNPEIVENSIKKLVGEGINIPIDIQVGYLTGQNQLPLGLFFAEEIKDEGIDNYLIVSAADHHYLAFGILDRYAKSKGLNLHLKDVIHKDSEKVKAQPSYWEEVMEKINR